MQAPPPPILLPATAHAPPVSRPPSSTELSLAADANIAPMESASKMRSIACISAPMGAEGRMTGARAVAVCRCTELSSSLWERNGGGFNCCGNCGGQEEAGVGGIRAKRGGETQHDGCDSSLGGFSTERD